MSLINDALQRAKQVQPAGPPADSNLQLRPADSPPESSRTFGPVWFVVLGAVLLAGIASLVIRMGADPVHASPMAAPSSAHPVPESISTPEPAVSDPVQPAPDLNALAAIETNVVDVPQPAPPPRLQGILFNPTRPSAIVDGATVFVGSAIGKQRVARITPQSVTLVGFEQTNVLSLASGQ